MANKLCKQLIDIDDLTGFLKIKPKPIIKAKESDRKAAAKAVREIIGCLNEALKELT